MSFKVGDRVQITEDDLLEGEKATVTAIGSEKNGWKGFVRIKFDRKNAVVHHATLTEQWIEETRVEKR